jgi:pyruvate,water dikinase
MTAKVFTNLSVPGLAARTALSGADGVGLLRAEFLVYQAGRHPLVLLGDTSLGGLRPLLLDGIRKVAAAFHPRPVLYRSLDLLSNELRLTIGGEIFERGEDNPALGCRGLARSRRDVDVFAVELEALAELRAEGLTSLHLMLPFVRWPDEIIWAGDQAARAGLRRADGWQLWMMVETPAAVLMADEFAPLVDGVSLGSNDLVQLVSGVARDSRHFARHDWDADLVALAAITWAASAYLDQSNVQVGICGDAVSRSARIVGLLADLGLDHISVSPERVAATRELVSRPQLEAGRPAATAARA